MSKFWFSVAAVFIVALLLLAGRPVSGISFSDLETECSFDRPGFSEIGLEDRSLSFEGRFKVDNPDSELSYRYSSSGDRVTLNVRSSQEPAPVSFTDDCRGVAVYTASTTRLDRGTYLVTVKHEGRNVNRQVIQVG